MMNYQYFQVSNLRLKRIRICRFNYLINGQLVAKIIQSKEGNSAFTVLPAKSDNEVMFCLQSYQGLSIDRSLVYLSYLQDRINTQKIY